ncbi:pleckstrin homology domain-containing family O member 1-A [Hippoglossus stenolepis]|uniref:pleckstrin homology domain-containing family O member 1-A n=1 Tax=Hippoglossus stenolepis TaxID=195615 RepID=UPI00159C7840|nr:pleckstrin homology domain-containing family O member 1-A [Hippoglossus stenolepis]
MEDGVKEPKFLGLAGWVKKAPGRLLASYKDRYIHLEKTEIVVYENEDLQKCVERIDLENYDRCHELKSPFKKRHRLILIRSIKSRNKVTDVKFQAQTAEEKEAWIKAFSEGINRAKNKVFDEVKVDESSNLDHVTRTRPKGNRNRRPPTRIHMKEVADVSSDGILRLDLDLEDAVMPSGTHHANTDTPKEAITVLMPFLNVTDAEDKQPRSSAEEIKPEDSPKKNIIKPPMPPTKETKLISVPEDEPDKDDASEKRVLKPPMPPSKEAKSFITPIEEATEEGNAEKMSEKSPDARKKTGAPPTPPNKPSSGSPFSSLKEPSQSRLNPHPPTPPSKEKKPSQAAPDQEVQGKADENKNKDDDNRKETTGTAVETDEDGHSIFKEALENIKGDVSPSTEEQVSEEASREYVSSHSPLITTKKKPEEPAQSDTQHSEEKSTISQPNEREDHTASLQTAPDSFDSSLQAEERINKYQVPSNEPPTDSFNLSPLLCHLPGEKKRKAEEKSVDSGQHSDNDSEGSGSEDTLAASTASLRGSHAGLDVLDAREDSIQISGQHSYNIQDITKPQVKSKVFPFPHSKPTIPLKPSTKVRSASIGDLLSDSSVCIPVRPHTIALAQRNSSPTDDVMKLETEVALEMEKTDELLSRMSQFQNKGDSEGKPENLLAEAMEKLRKADHVLREVKKLKLAKNSIYRKSW